MKFLNNDNELRILGTIGNVLVKPGDLSFPQRNFPFQIFYFLCFYTSVKIILKLLQIFNSQAHQLLEQEGACQYLRIPERLETKTQAQKVKKIL